jgi:hypothetical protein
MKTSVMDVVEFVANRSDEELTRVAAEILKRVWGRQPAPLQPLSLTDMTDHVVGYLVPATVNRNDPNFAEIIAEAERRANDPNQKYISFDEFLARVSARSSA